MAMTLHETATVVVGYFSTGDAAHQAVHQLIDAGFSPAEIGAAFNIGTRGNSNAQEFGQPDVGGSLRGDLGTTQATSHVGSQNSFGGPASTTNDVQVSALGGGAGSAFDGAGRPGPIPGSSLEHTGLPSELQSTMPHDPLMPQSSRHFTARPSFDGDTATGTPQQAKSSESWTEKLKDIFSSHEANKQPGPAGTHVANAPVTKESQDFGTGEGHLPLTHSYRYSQPVFEHSLSSHGLQSEHARHLSQRIGHGGAIVTVHAAARAIEAERVLEAAGGEVRFSAIDTTETTSREMDGRDSHVELFGTIHTNYSRELR